MSWRVSMVCPCVSACENRALAEEAAALRGELGSLMIRVEAEATARAEQQQRNLEILAQLEAVQVG